MLCPACALDDLTPLADLGEMPVACGLTFPDPASARASARGRMELGACGRCGHVANLAFEPDLAVFDASFEAALFHSPTYTAYAIGVTDRLVKRYDLAGKRVLEIASGGRVLLDHLRDLGCEPTGVPGADPGAGGYDMVLARFVVEHMADPGALLTRIRAVSSRAFIEIPDAGYDLTTAGWDCIYPHVGYFRRESLEALCARTGWRVERIGTAFHDQYLWAEIAATEPQPPTGGDARSGPALPNGRDAAPREEQAAPLGVAGPKAFAAATTRWQAELAGHRAVVWGAGTRGTMFCNRVDPKAESIVAVVDRNPSKHERFLPITGHRVVSPATLTQLRPDLVVLTNPAYRDEITAELVGLGVSARIAVA